jgi:eukaryotic-like serine/threonine-protein kinase
MGQTTRTNPADDQPGEQTLAPGEVSVPTAVVPTGLVQHQLKQVLTGLMNDVVRGHEPPARTSGAASPEVAHDRLPNDRAGETSLLSVGGQGTQFIAGTRVALESVVNAHRQGKSPEEIQRSFPALSLEKVYRTIAYYLGHRHEVDEYVRQQKDAPAAWFGKQERGPNGNGRNDSGIADVTASPSPMAELEQTAAPLWSDGADDLQESDTVAPGAGTFAGDVDATVPPPPFGRTTVPPSEVADGTVPPPAGGVRPEGPASETAPPHTPTHSVTSSDPTLRHIETTGKLGPYEIVNKLGQGGMGAVYLARQVSLDRKVAVKVLTSQLSADASFVARFTREAYAAAQLTHHNIVQIHDIGEENDIHFFSMEFVEGKTLKRLLQTGGRVEPASAVSYILQAARGLKFAHDHCMIHRDIKPDNLMLNDQGLVKVADLGLVKRKGVADEKNTLLNQATDASETGAASAMGTPAYMPPEQASDAANVDVRADIYSLGCTLYDLVTGHPPFTGRTAVEVMTKHATEAVIPPDKLVDDVPKSLSEILLKMMAKKPQDRYANMDEVIEALEEYIAVSRGGAAGPFEPQEHHVQSLELAVSHFNSASWEYMRRFAIWTYFAGGGLGLFTMVFGSHMRGFLKVIWDWHRKIAAGVMGLMVMTFLCYAFLSAFSRRAYLSRQFKQFLSAARPMDWIQAGLTALIVLGVLSVLHMQVLGLTCLGAAFLIALAFHSTIDRAIRNERRHSLKQLESTLKTMRQQGMDEDDLRLFVCEHAGDKWEEIYIALFGSDQRIPARIRRQLRSRGVERKKWGALGNPIVHAIDTKMRHRQDERQIEYFAKIEERKLLADGMRAEQAKTKAHQIALNIVAKARRFKDAIDNSQVAHSPGSIDANAVLADDIDLDFPDMEHDSKLRRALYSITESVLGPQMRMVAGMVILASFLLWLRVTYPTLPTLVVQNVRQAIIDFRSGQSAAHPNAALPAKKNAVTANAQDATIKGITDATSESIADQSRQQIVKTEKKMLLVLGSWQGGLAGALLAISSLFRKFRAGPIMLGSTLVTLIVGRYLVIPTGGLLPPQYLGMVLGTMLAFIAFILGQERPTRRTPFQKVDVKRTDSSSKLQGRGPLPTR